MYRYQFHLQLQMGHWRDFRSLVVTLNAALHDKGLVPYQLVHLPPSPRTRLDELDRLGESR